MVPYKKATPLTPVELFWQVKVYSSVNFPCVMMNILLFLQYLLLTLHLCSTIIFDYVIQNVIFSVSKNFKLLKSLKLSNFMIETHPHLHLSIQC